MGVFVLRFFTLSLILGILLRKEFADRKKLALKPTSIKELFDAGSKWKKGSDPKVSAFLFALSSFVGFSLWESLIICVFNLLPYFALTLIPGVGLAAWIFLKRETFHPWTQKEALLGAAALGLITGSFGCWAFFAWVYFRSLFLKKS